MAGDTTHVKGLSALNDLLQQFPVKVEKNMLRGGLRRAANTVKPEAQARIHSISGKLAKGLKVGTRSKGGTVTATLKAKGPHAFIGHMLEFTGAKPHQIAPKTKSGKKVLAFDGKFYKKVQHRGFRKQPFLRPALDAKATAAVVAMAEYIKERMATKEGIDTAYIMIEGDE